MSVGRSKATEAGDEGDFRGEHSRRRAGMAAADGGRPGKCVKVKRHSMSHTRAKPLREARIRAILALRMLSLGVDSARPSWAVQ